MVTKTNRAAKVATIYRQWAISQLIQVFFITHTAHTQVPFYGFIFLAFPLYIALDCRLNCRAKSTEFRLFRLVYFQSHSIWMLNCGSRAMRTLGWLKYFCAKMHMNFGFLRGSSLNSLVGEHSKDSVFSVLAHLGFLGLYHQHGRALRQKLKRISHTLGHDLDTLSGLN